jgi:5-methylcytosine-specific restriction enzyme subunit McrC
MAQVLSIPEYTTVELPRDAVPEGIGRQIHREYREQVSVETPSFKNDDKWQFSANGWIGFLPLSAGWGIRLTPKTPIANVIRMLEYAYGLQSLHIFDELAPASSLEEFFSELADVLSGRVLDRIRRGLYRAYVREESQLSYIRGRLDVADRLRRPWETRLPCRYEEHQADIEENQILAATLGVILRSGLCHPRVLPSVRRAYRRLQPFAGARQFRAEDCLRRLYNRLNADYQPLHALCRFFLANAAPGHLAGEHAALPFMVRMDQLFEEFVAEWLRAHLPPELSLRAQEGVGVAGHGQVNFKIDMVLYRTDTGAPLAVLDTKYKVAGGPTSDDFAQVVTYAQIKGCQDAMLVYPIVVPRGLDATLRNVRVRSLRFEIGGDLEVSGREGLLCPLVSLCGERR